MKLRKLDELKSECGLVRVAVYRDYDWHEYRVRLYIKNILQPFSDYMTDDDVDAYQTAKAMLQHGIDKL